jgi:hypothetical protein
MASAIRRWLSIWIVDMVFHQMNEMCKESLVQMDKCKGHWDGHV